MTEQAIANLRRQRNLALIALVASVIGIGMIYLFTPLKPEKIVDEASGNPPAVQDSSESPPSSDANSTEISEDQAIIEARKKSCLTTIENEIERTKSFIQLAQFNRKTLRELLSNDKGRSIAADGDLIEVYLAIAESEPAPPELSNHLVELDAIRTRASFVTEYGERTKLDSLEKSARDLGVDLNALISPANQFRERLDALTVLSERAKPSSKTLEQAIRDYRAAITAKHELRLAKARRQAREQQLALEETQLRDLNERNAAIKKQLAEAQHRAHLSDLAAKKVEMQRRTELQRLEREFSQDKQEVLGLLKPFISPGRTQHLYVNGYKIANDPTPRPVSYSNLVGKGYLENTRDSAMAFWRSTSTGNDRPIGSFPDSPSGHVGFEQALPQVQRAQELLRKYGEFLVEKGMLSQ